MIQKTMYDKKDILSTIIKNKSLSAENTEAMPIPKNQNDNITNTPLVLYHFGIRK